MSVRTTTQNMRITNDEKHAWNQAAIQAGYTRTEKGQTVGNVSRWLRELGNQAAAK